MFLFLCSTKGLSTSSISTNGAVEGDSGEPDCFCGQKKTIIRQNRRRRSIGGEYSDVNEFPWAALLNLNSTETGTTGTCGGTLIKDRLGYNIVG